MVFHTMNRSLVRYTLNAALGAAVLVLVLPRRAEAYVDPGTGGMLMQLLLAGAMGGLVLFRSGLRRVVGWFQRSPRPSDDAPAIPLSSDAAADRDASV